MAKSNANSKLQNVKAIKQMLAGTHKSQTKTSIYTGNTKTKIEDSDIEERFENGDPKIWIETDPVSGRKTRVTQHEGFKSRQPANSILDEINKIIRMPNECPNCGKNMYDDEVRLNKKFWKTHKTCFDCVVKMETQLRAEGKYEEYERKKLHANAESFFKTADTEVEILKRALEGKLQFVQNADGKVESYDQEDYKEKYLKYIDEQYNRFKKETLNQLKSKEK